MTVKTHFATIPCMNFIILFYANYYVSEWNCTLFVINFANVGSVSRIFYICDNVTLCDSVTVYTHVLYEDKALHLYIPHKFFNDLESGVDNNLTVEC